jgi:hypothetical protein
MIVLVWEKHDATTHPHAATTRTCMSNVLPPEKLGNDERNDFHYLRNQFLDFLFFRPSIIRAVENVFWLGLSNKGVDFCSIGVML